MDHLTKQEKEELLPDETAVKEFEERWERKDLTLFQEGSIWYRIITARLVQPQYQSFPNKPEGFSLKFFHDYLFKKNLENEDPELYVFADYVRPNKRVEKMQIIDKDTKEVVGEEFFIPEMRKEQTPIWKLPKFVRGKHEVVFDKEKSVFKPWIKDSPKIVRAALTADLDYWKCKKFIRDADDLA